VNLPGTHADFPVPCTPRTAEAKQHAAVQALQARRFVLRHVEQDEAREILDILGLINMDRELKSSERVRREQRNAARRQSAAPRKGDRDPPPGHDMLDPNASAIISSGKNTIDNSVRGGSTSTVHESRCCARCCAANASHW